MSFCPNCGHEALPGANFCQFCGTRLTAVQSEPLAQTVVSQPVTVQPVVTQPVVTQPVVMQPVITQTVSVADEITSRREDDYTVFLVSLGTCPPSMGAALLADACGYSDADAMVLVRECPVPVAQYLTERQAAYLAQAMAEYGMDVAVYDSNGYQNVQTNLTTVFRQDGGFLAKAAQVIGLIGLANRLTPSMMRRHDYPFGGIRPVLYPRPRVMSRPPRRPSLRINNILGMLAPKPIKASVPRAPRVAQPRPAAPKAPGRAAAAPKAPGKSPAAPGRRPGGKKGPGGMGPGGMGPGGMGPGGRR